MDSYADFLLRLAAILAAAITVVYQLGRQHRSSLELQKENFKDQERIKLFDQIAEKISEAEASVGTVSLWGSFVPSALRLYRRQTEIPGFQPAPIKHRSTELLELQQKASRAVTSVISAIEYREVVVPGFLIFRYAIAQQSERCQQAFQDFHQASLPLLPIDPPSHLAAQGVAPRTLREPADEDIAHLEEVGRRMQTEYWTLSNYLNDLSREAQNRLLGTIFGQKVHPRMPLDRDVLVISSRKEDLPKIEERLSLQEHLHPDSMPSRILYPQGARSLRERLMFWRR